MVGSSHLFDEYVRIETNLSQCVIETDDETDDLHDSHDDADDVRDDMGWKQRFYKGRKGIAGGW